jgi:hypothetical protein
MREKSSPFHGRNGAGMSLRARIGIEKRTGGRKTLIGSGSAPASSQLHHNYIPGELVPLEFMRL